ncbi:MAG: A/G-specific adenine glycosylase [Magnetococcales bacterium]|nr:A/G-specific adenine glycosylase [Magnetococcales bacterium]
MAMDLAKALLAHYDQHGRSLPWRGVHDPYLIWISEIMLQQTTVSTVIPYYQRFIKQFPSVEKLADAPLDSVLSLWQGLGYYQRARNLHKSAGLVVSQWAGCFPVLLEEMESLPGIGPSTAAAILAISHDQPHAILDGNVKRVLTRLKGIDSPIEQLATVKELWRIARALTPVDRPGDYAQAIMDLGATLCSRKKPHCDACPWLAVCQAASAGNPERYPVRRPKKTKPKRHQLVGLILDSQDRLLLLQRPEKGLLAGLWEPFGLDMTDSPEHKDQLFLQVDQLGIKGSVKEKKLPLVTHVFTHFHLTVHAWLIRSASDRPNLNCERPYCWVGQKALDDKPVSTLHAKVIERIGMKGQSIFM